MHIGYWWESQKERDHWEDQDVRGVDNIKMDLREIGTSYPMDTGGSFPGI
jgi:hypothetical protein